MLKLGINDVDNETYHGDREYLSSSGLKLLFKDPKQYYKKYVLKESEKNSNQSALDLGTYVHTLCFEPHLIEEQFAIYDGRKAGKDWEKFKEENNSKIILGRMQESLGKDIQEVFNNSEIVKEIVKTGLAEHTLCCKMEDIGIKVRADFICPERGIIADLKTTSGELNAYSLQKTIANYHYDLSAALYCDAFAEYYSKPFDFYFIFVDKANCNIQIVKSAQSLLHNGRLKYMSAIYKYKKCLETDNWGKEEILTLGPADWDKLEVEE